MDYSLTPQIGLFGVQEQINTSTFHTSHYDPVFISSSHRPNLYSSRFKCPIKDDAKPNDHPRGGLDDCNAQKRSENTADINDAKPNGHPRGGLDDCNAQKRSKNTADIDDAKPNGHPRGGLDDCNAQKRSENTADIESNDERRVRSALSKLDPHILLQQLDSPSPPKWQTVLTDWVSVTIPLPIFREWNGKVKDWDHLYYEYDVSTERLMIKCMLSDIHESIPSNFLEQVGEETRNLSYSAKKALRTGSNTSMAAYQIEVIMD
jgi:hypothetical protein